MIIVEHAEDRCSANRADPSPDAAPAAAAAAGPAESSGDLRVSALRAA
jgi:hypothetical protein